MCQDGRDSIPTGLSVAPCSGPSRRGLAGPKREAEKRDGQPCRLLRAAPGHGSRPGRRNGLKARTKELREMRSYR